MTSSFPKVFRFFFLACLASASEEFSSLPSKEISTARCRVFCLNTDSEFLRQNLNESCSSLQSCLTCWQTCELLYQETNIWSPMCHSKWLCNGGCNTACEYWLLHKNKDTTANISGIYTFDRKPISLVNAEKTLLYWLVPTALDGSHNNSTIVYAIFIEETSRKNTPSATKQWKQVKQSPYVSAILSFRILPKQLIRLVAITEHGIVANTYLQSKSISFPEFFSPTVVLDKGLLQVKQFLWTSPQSLVTAIIQELPDGRVQAALFWQNSTDTTGSRSVYKVLWRMLSCHVYQSLHPCYLHGHYNVTLVSVSKNVQAQLKIDLRFNSEYVIQVEKIGVDSVKETNSSNVDATLIIVQTPRCVNPDSSFFTCKSHLSSINTTKTESAAEAILNWIPLFAVIVGILGVFVFLCVMVSFCLDKNSFDCIRKNPIPPLKKHTNSMYCKNIEVDQVIPNLDWNKIILVENIDFPAKSVYDMVTGYYANKPALFKGVNENSSCADWKHLLKERTQMQKLKSGGDRCQHRNVIHWIGSFVAKKTLVFVFNCKSNLRLNDYLHRFTTEISCTTSSGVCFDNFLSTNNLVWFSQQIADGMCFLASQCIAHQYLACSNVLVTSKNILKLCNISVTFDSVTKRPAIDNRLFWKWMAPEILCDGFYTIYADIWSFGILLWELFTLGDIPYADYNNNELYSILERGYKLPKSSHCPDFIYDLMGRCWQMRASSRPSFSQLARELISGARTLVINDHFRRKSASAISTSNEDEAVKLAPKSLGSRLQEEMPSSYLPWYPKSEHSDLGSFQRSSSMDTLLSLIESGGIVGNRAKSKIVETKISFPW